MANVIKKLEFGNPLINLELFRLYDIYQEAKTDEEIANAYHEILNAVEGSAVAERMVYAMISYSTQKNVDDIFILINQINVKDEDSNTQYR